VRAVVGRRQHRRERAAAVPQLQPPQGREPGRRGARLTNRRVPLLPRSWPRCTGATAPASACGLVVLEVLREPCRPPLSLERSGQEARSAASASRLALLEARPVSELRSVRTRRFAPEFGSRPTKSRVRAGAFGRGSASPPRPSPHAPASARRRFPFRIHTVERAQDRCDCGRSPAGRGPKELRFR
jgi:hypothetical protein